MSHPSSKKRRPSVGNPAHDSARQSLPAWWNIHAGKPATYRIFVRDLVLPALIGIYPHERTTHQNVRVNVDIEARDPGQHVRDDISTVVSYEDVVTGIKAILATGHIALVETLAERIAALCLDDPRCLTARVRVEKLDVFAETDSVGIEIERSRAKDRHQTKIVAFTPPSTQSRS